MKTHPEIRRVLAGGRRISYGARALSEGGLQSLPKLTFPGGLLIGDAAGFVNTTKAKGIHTAMKSGMLAAEAVMENMSGECTAYAEKFEKSWLKEELYIARNVRPGFRLGLLPGMIYAGIDAILLKGRAPWTLRNHADHDTLEKAKDAKKKDYPKPDGVLTFDRASSVYLSNTRYAEGQPCHLKLRDASIPVKFNLPEYAEPAQRYCPAGVYEIVEGAEGSRFVINAQNCVHCKACDIKDPAQNIDWTVPQGGDGPQYEGM
jgi:electron-transferring-flavoprotein dehydrogenase